MDFASPVWVTQAKVGVLLYMFIRKKKNRSGTTSVVVVDKSRGDFKELKTIGVSNDSSEIEALWREGKRWIEARCGGSDIFEQAAKELEEKQVVEYLLSNVEKILINGAQLILNRVFTTIGFDSIDDNILKHLVKSMKMKNGMGSKDTSPIHRSLQKKFTSSITVCGQ